MVRWRRRHKLRLDGGSALPTPYPRQLHQRWQQGSRIPEDGRGVGHRLRLSHWWDRYEQGD